MKIKINTQIILDLIIITFFVLFSMTIMKFILPNGFNTKFLVLASKITGSFFIIINLLFIIFWFFDKNIKIKKFFYFPNFKDLILLILPLSPVINYGLINFEFLNFNGWIYLIGTTLIFIMFFSFLLPIMFSYLTSYNTLMFSGLLLTFTILSMSKISILHSPGDFILSKKIILEGSYIIILFIVIYGFFLLNKAIAYTTVILFVFSGIAMSINEKQFKSTKISDPVKDERLVNFLNKKDNKIVKKRNIYVLVYESYANLETLDYYGFDNTDHYNFLRKKGFKIYDGVYSNSAASVGTTSRVLELKGEIPRDGRYYTSGNAFGLEIFKANGYKTYAVFKSPYFFTSSDIKWDQYYPKEDITQIGGKSLTRAIFEGEFRFDIFDNDYNYTNYLELKKKYLVSKNKNKFFYTHNNFPGHSQNSGKCKLNERKSYFSRMEIANTEMKNDIKNIMNNDKNPIIVLLSDHGPYLTKNCHTLENYDIKTINKYDIQDRYGTFLSIHWPKDIPNFEHNIIITQDILPAILSRITNNENLFNELKVERKFFDRFQTIAGGINVYNGIIKGGKDDGNPLFNNRSYILP